MAAAKRQIHATVLLLDDDKDQLFLFSEVIKKGGLQVVTANSAHAALEILKTQKIDCVVSDVMMPELSGGEFVRLLRETSGLEYLPVIMITATEDDLEIELMKSGADLFCVKRQAPKMLVEQIRLLLS